VLVERLLERARARVLLEPFHRRDGGAVGLCDERETAPRGRAVDQHGARPADAVLASDVRARQPEIVAQEVDEQQAGLHVTLDRLTVHREAHAHVRRHHDSLRRRAAARTASSTSAAASRRR
jgi:hypothetical protein